MSKIDSKLTDYLIACAPDLEAADWIKDAVSNYENLIRCHQCDSDHVTVIADIKAVVKCMDCDAFTSENISLDKVPTASYTDVQFLQEKKIIEILEAQSKI